MCANPTMADAKARGAAAFVFFTGVDAPSKGTHTPGVDPPWVAKIESQLAGKAFVLPGFRVGHSASILRSVDTGVPVWDDDVQDAGGRALASLLRVIVVALVIEGRLERRGWAA